jgi:hypothetical protein
LPRRSDGHFVTTAEPVEFVAIGAAPMPGATSGTGGSGTGYGTGTYGTGTYGDPRPATPPGGGTYEPVPRQPPAGTQTAPPPSRTPPVPY